MPVRLRRRRRRNRAASRCPRAPTWSGTATCPTCCPARSTAIACHGPYEPEKGHRFNPNKVLLDPYAKAIARETKWSRRDVGLQASAIRRPICRSTSATTPRCAPLAAVIDEAFTWGDDRPPQTPWNKTIIYEMHVKGFTKLHPEVPEKLRGTYAGLGSEAAIDYLQRPGRHGRRAAAGPRPRRRPAPGRSRA